ncbi:DNA ligase [Pectobacterium phage Q19]|uniref:DNA ligase n=1 Tax=Pectobacterium phage Q19 TaxID=2500576 RepID=A0A678ZRW6_9CAUD|nr:DNA ligase [Pectobacterium phage Q19]
MSINIVSTKPYKAVSFVESSVQAALERSSYLIADIKYDGVRGNILVDNTGDSEWLSRVGKQIPALTHLSNFYERWSRLLADDRNICPEGFMLDGELMVAGVDFNTGSGLLRTKWVKPNNFKYHHGFANETGKTEFKLDPEFLQVRLYAVVPLHVVESGEDHQVQNLLMPYHVDAMIELLVEYFPEVEWLKAESYDVFDMVELNALYEKARADGHEGLVVKDPHGIYKRGKKSGWWKMKPENEADGVVVGLVWGTKGLANEGKVIGFEVELENGRVVNATNIPQALMEEFTKQTFEDAGDLDEEEQVEFITKVYSNDPPLLLSTYVGWACQISYMEETPDGSLRHPSWTMWRGTEENPEVKI